jgi:hypothetical protein
MEVICLRVDRQSLLNEAQHFGVECKRCAWPANRVASTRSRLCWLPQDPDDQATRLGKDHSHLKPLETHQNLRRRMRASSCAPRMPRFPMQDGLAVVRWLAPGRFRCLIRLQLGSFGVGKASNRSIWPWLFRGSKSLDLVVFKLKKMKGLK